MTFVAIATFTFAQTKQKSNTNNFKTAKSAKQAFSLKKQLIYTPVKDANTSIESVKQTRSTIINEGFEGGAVPPTDWTLTSTNVTETWGIDDYDPHTGSYNATCLYDDNLQDQNELLITPLLDFTSVSNAILDFWFLGSKYYAVTPYDNCNLNILISTDGGTTWTTDTLWDEEVDTTWTTWEWTNVQVNLSAYAGESTIKIAFQYYGNDGAQFSLDDIMIYESGQYDIEIGDANTNSEYTIIPLKQIFPVNFSANAANVGFDTLTNITLNVDVNSGLFTDNISKDTLLSGEDTVLTTPNYFTPIATGIFNVNYSLSVNEIETDITNNTDSLSFEVSDTIMAREDGIATGSLGIGSSGGTLGQIFTLTNNDTITSVSFYLKNPTLGDNVSVDVYTFTSTPDSIIASTPVMTITDTAPQWYTLPIDGNFKDLAAGTFFLGVKEYNNNITIGTTTNFFTPNAGWFIYGANPWATSESSGFEVTYLLRANLGEVIPLPGFDAGVVSFSSPVSACCLDNEQVTVTIKNFGADTIKNFDVSYDVGGIIVTETITNTIISLQTIDYTFTGLADLSVEGTTYDIKAYTSLIGDADNNNDTANYSVTHIAPANIPYTMGFEPADDFSGWKIEDANADENTWDFYATDGNTEPGVAKYYYNSTNAANDWLFSTCIELVAATTYHISFYYKTSASFPEKLKLLMGDEQTISAMTTTIVDLGEITEADYVESSTDFTVPNSGVYFFAWYAYSDADEYYICVDDISIEEGSGIKENSDNTSVNIYPNPAKDLINIKSSDNIENIKIYNTIGQLVFDEMINDNSVQINTSEYKSGVYFIKIRTKDGPINKKITITKN